MTKIDRKQLHEEAKRMLPTLIEWRRDFHRWPELGFQEVKTSERVAKILSEYGLEVTRGLAKTGVVGLLDSGRPGRTVALRADMDALPITEATGFPFASENEGVMHACGHDGHMTAVLGATALLAGRRGEWEGRVKLIFQPAEEMLGGGREMCEGGVLKSPDVESIYGLHLWPWLPKGEIAIIDGAAMAAFDEFEIEVLGRSAHGASPHMGVDALVTAARLVDALQHVVAREVDPQDPVVVTVGEIEGGTATNIIADRVRLAGGVRTFDPAVRSRMASRIERVTAGVTQAHGAEYRFTWREGYPALYNESGSVERYARAVEGVLGSGAVVQDYKPSMASEDFAYYLQHIPGAYAFVGVQEGEETAGLHTPQFQFDEAVLADAAAVMAAVALEALAA